MMTERLLQFIWQFQYFNARELKTTEGEAVQVISPGQFNRNQGPDFLHGKIRIGQTEWAGMIELHIRSTDWNKHHHQHDPNYGNVILHVVWQHDSDINSIPVVELAMRVSRLLFQRYEALMNSRAFIACEKSIQLMPRIHWHSWKERLLAERLLRKSTSIESNLKTNNYHWEETFWWLLARNFGSTVNSEHFEMMARSIPIRLLAKHKNQIHQLESLLMGQAGLLEYDFKDAYAILEKREYDHFKRAYHLKSVDSALHFLRMRPGNFPTIRLAQLAMLIHQSSHLFSIVRETNSIKELRKNFAVTANDYWHYHYRFDESSDYKPKTLGHSMIDNIIINTISPSLFSYGRYHQDIRYQEKALQWLEETNAESNAIIKGFEQLGVHCKNAFDSQALIELKKEYCSQQKCLDCAVGNYILKQARSGG